jgi:hypothetical protein
MSQLFGIAFGTAPVATVRFSAMDQARLMSHLSGAFTGLLEIHRMLGERYCFRSRDVFAGFPLGVLVDSSLGVFSISSLHALIVVP